MRTSNDVQILDANLDVINPATEEKQDTQITNETDKLHDYKLSDIDDGDTEAVTTYLGYLRKDGYWYIAKYTSTSVRYVKGTSGYNWANRASETYNTFNNIF